MAITFQFISSYQGEVDYDVFGDGARYRVGLRRSYEDANRERFNPEGWREVETSVGILRRSVCDNAGEVSGEVLDAFNMWRLSEFNRMLAERRARVTPDEFDRFYAPLKPPTLAVAGRWARGEGWKATSTILANVRDIESYAVIIRAIHERGAIQADAVAELGRRGLWLSDAQKQQAGLIPAPATETAVA